MKLINLINFKVRILNFEKGITKIQNGINLNKFEYRNIPNQKLINPI